MKREKNNIVNIVFCLLALLPILLALISCYSNGSFDVSSLEVSLSTLTSIPFMTQLKEVILNLFNNVPNTYLSLAIDYFAWLFVLSVVDLCYYAVLFFFRIIKDLIDKLGGNI